MNTRQCGLIGGLCCVSHSASSTTPLSRCDWSCVSRGRLDAGPLTPVRISSDLSAASGLSYLPTPLPTAPECIFGSDMFQEVPVVFVAPRAQKWRS